MTKPIIEKAKVFDDDTLQLEVFDNLREIRCGQCGQSFGLTTGKENDYFAEIYHFCMKCGEPVDWT